MSRLAIPEGIVDAIYAEVARHGIRDVETGMFLLAPANSSTATTLALAGERGVTRRREQFAVTGRALSRLFTHARRQGLLVAAQIHSHAGAAFLSDVDLRHGFAVEGFTTAVIPNYGGPPRNPAAWGWWRNDGRRWQAVAPYTTTAGTGTILTFDEDGIDAR